jgi:hypothetical protein
VIRDGADQSSIFRAREKWRALRAAELAPARLAELAKNYRDHDEARDLAEQAAM